MGGKLGPRLKLGADVVGRGFRIAGAVRPPRSKTILAIDLDLPVDRRDLIVALNRAHRLIVGVMTPCDDYSTFYPDLDAHGLFMARHAKRRPPGHA